MAAADAITRNKTGQTLALSTSHFKARLTSQVCKAQGYWEMGIENVQGRNFLPDDVGRRELGDQRIEERRLVCIPSWVNGTYQSD